jgi:acetolactate synthase I/II/III large subunit
MTFTPLAQELPAADAIVRALDEGGVRVVLGMPGGLTGPLWQALHAHPRIRALQVREEAIGSHMAEAFGRATGQPAVVMGQGEWIAGNAGQGYMEALLGASPLVILTEMSDGASLSHHAPYQSGTGDYGTWDVRSALAGVTKRVMVSYDPAQAVQHTQLALKHALTGEPGPVAVVFHSASLRGTVGAQSVPRIYPTSAYLPRVNRAVDADALGAAADAVRGARRPVIVAGNGVRVGRACQSLARLASVLDAPVATTASGKGVFPETDPLSVGVMGPFGWTAANAAVADADVVVAVGTKLGPSDTMNEDPGLLDPARQTLVQIDVEPLNAAWTFPVDHVLLGDASYVMDRLCDACRAANGAVGGMSGRERAAEMRRRHTDLDGSSAVDDQVPFLPQRVVSILEEELPDDGVVTCDAGENRLFMMHWYRSKAQGEYLQPAAGGGMGYAVPAAMAAKLAFPGRPVIAVCGDGGFAMSVHALMTAVQEDLPVAVLVFNNGALGWVLHGMGDKAVAANFAQFDHAAIARSIGCEGVSITSSEELRAALRHVPSTSTPLVIDVPVSLAVSFKDVSQRPVTAQSPADAGSPPSAHVPRQRASR